LLLSFSLDPRAPTATSTLSLHDALPISVHVGLGEQRRRVPRVHAAAVEQAGALADPGSRHAIERRADQAVRLATLDRVAGPGIGDRKSTRLNSSHDQISYAVFCLKKKKT